MVNTRESESPARRLEGLTAVVTGAAHGIGRAYAEQLGAEGANVVIADLDAEGSEVVSKELEGRGIGALAVRTDVADEASVTAMAEAAMARFGRIDITVNNAAMFSVVPMSRSGFDEIQVSEFERMLRINVIGSWLVVRATVPDMRKRGWGKVINVSSGSVFKGSAGRIHYVSSKAAVIGFTRTLARELGPDGITVNCIAPGSTLSEENADAATLAMRERGIEDRAIRIVQRPEHLAGTVAFLASHDSDFMTGQTLVVDGGSVRCIDEELPGNSRLLGIVFSLSALGRNCDAVLSGPETPPPRRRAFVSRIGQPVHEKNETALGDPPLERYRILAVDHFGAPAVGSCVSEPWTSSICD